MGEKRWAAGETKVRRGSLRKEDGRVDVTPVRVDLCCLFRPLSQQPRGRWPLLALVFSPGNSSCLGCPSRSGEGG